MAQLEVKLRRIHKDDIQAALRGYSPALSEGFENEVADIILKILREYHLLDEDNAPAVWKRKAVKAAVAEHLSNAKASS